MTAGTIIYTRKSTEDKNKQMLSLDDQIKVAHELIDRHSLSPLIHEPFQESKTGTKPGIRDGFNKMVRMLKAGKGDTIVCWRLNRLSRNGGDAGKIIDLVNIQGINIVTEVGTYNKKSAPMVWIELMQASESSKALSIDVKRGLATKARLGHASQKAYLGYLNTPHKEKGEKCIIADPDRWELMRYWFDLMLSGKYNVMESLEIVTEKGLKTRKGKPVSKTTAYRTLTHIFYTGRFYFHGEVMEGKHPRMISDEEHQKIKKLINGVKHSKKKENPLPFKGFIKCGECGTTISGDMRTKKLKKSGELKQYSYYRCNQQTTEKGKKTCAQPRLKAKELNKQIKEYLDRLEIDPEFIQLVQDVMKRRNAKEFEVEKKQKEIQTKNLDLLMGKKKTLFEMKIDGLIAKEDYLVEKDKLLQEEIQIKSYINRDGTAYWESVIDETLNFAQTVRDRFESGDINQKILVLKTLSSDLFIKNEKLDLSPKFAFIFLKEAEKQVKANSGEIGPNSDLVKEQITCPVPYGAGNGNRTRICYLASSCSTIELYPR